MIAKKFLAATLAAIFFASPNVFAQEEENAVDAEIQKTIARLKKKDLPLSLEARYFSPSADAHLDTSSVNLGGNELGLKNNLNLLSDRAPEIILRYKNFSLDYMRLSKSGGGVFSDEKKLNFGGESFSDEVSAKNTFHYFRLNADNEIISLMGTGAYWSYGVTGIFWRGSVEGSRKNYFAAVPTAGIGIYMAIMPKMKIYSHVSGIYLGGHGHLCDFEAGMRYSPSKNFTLTAGFRSVEFNLKHRGRGDFRLNGPFIGLRSDF